MWKNWNLYTFAYGNVHGASALEDRLTVSLNDNHIVTIRSSKFSSRYTLIRNENKNMFTIICTQIFKVWLHFFLGALGEFLFPWLAVSRGYLHFRRTFLSSKLNMPMAGQDFVRLYHSDSYSPASLSPVRGSL